MPSHSVPQAKNHIRKALWRLVDKEPNQREISRLWSHFNSQCAYCGKFLNRDDRAAHVDHLDANRSVNRNHISSRVLACNICNGDEKCEMDWQEFLALKCGQDEAAYVIRSSRIREWQEQCGIPIAMDAALTVQVVKSVEACNAVLDREVKTISLMLNGLPEQREED
jgi:hypothetical protein